MLVLFDHGTPKGLIRALPGHAVHTTLVREGSFDKGDLDALRQEIEKARKT